MRDDRLQALACSARLGDEVAFGRLVEATQGRLVALLRLQLRDAGEAEDVAQETYLRVWSRLQRYDPERCFLTWLFTIGRRQGIGRLRRRRVLRLFAVGEEMEGLDAPQLAHHDPRPALDAQEDGERLWSRVRSLLGTEAASALWLRYAEDLSAREIGGVLGKREGAVRVLLSRSRERLGELLHDPAERAPAPLPPSEPLAGTVTPRWAP